MNPLSNNVFLRKETTYAPQKSSIIQTVEPETAWIVEAVGPQAKHVKAGDRVMLGAMPREIVPGKYSISEDSILAMYQVKAS